MATQSHPMTRIQVLVLLLSYIILAADFRPGYSSSRASIMGLGSTLEFPLAWNFQFPYYLSISVYYHTHSFNFLPNFKRQKLGDATILLGKTRDSGCSRCLLNNITAHSYILICRCKSCKRLMEEMKSCC